MLKHALIASLTLVACDKSNSVGEVGDSAADDADDDDDEGDDDDDVGTDGDDDDDDDDDDDVLTCEPGETYAEPAACEVGANPQLPEAGCYEPCGLDEEGVDNGTCGAGTTCQTVQYNPCPCPPDAEACCGACGGDIQLCMPETFDAVCASIIGKHFESLEELECGPAPDPGVFCNWTIDFLGDGSFLWMYSDIGQAGTYTCADGTLEATGGLDEIEASFDLESGILTWNGEEYQAVAT